ncbi:RibD family protein [Meridianimarinicoccus aquatilis]|uniref:RibD family protein n=1 Tax=Meridianimarinicoccus aquatilis TaxID=2552766 RepID=A0A4R6AVX6_9RHOB|nr:RibD family protein [Fluviibacterium aquatile]TDL87754.1 RibD family protein [Fluviibacterium aquatile]
MIDETAPTLPVGESSSALHRAFGPLLEARRKGRPHIIGQLGLSLDGRIATESGESRYINGTEALHHLHRIRALVDAVIVGAGTVEADDPQLTVRHCDGRDPARVVIDPNGRIGRGAKIWSASGARRIVLGGAADLPDGVEKIAVPKGPLTAKRIIGHLADQGLHRVLVEGGADTLGRFLAEGAVDSLHLLYGRVIIGSGKAGLTLPPLASLDDAPRPHTDTHVFDDGDFLVACRFNT